VVPNLFRWGRSFLNLVEFDAQSDTVHAASIWESFVKRVRVLVANQPRLMRELVMATISDQPDIELCGEVVDEGELTRWWNRFNPDVLILG